MVCTITTLALIAAGCSGGDGGRGEPNKVITVAAVDTMEDTETLLSEFEKNHPDTKVQFVILPENELREEVPKDIATEGGQYDVVAIGPYEAPIWAARGWLTKLDDYVGKGDYDVEDLMPQLREALSYQGHLYAVPYYGESSFLMYRKDLFAAAALTMPGRPTWQQVAEFAAKLHDPKNGVVGICLRGQSGWGQLLAPLNTVILTFGGRWFDENWNPQLTSPETKQAVQFYVDLVRNYGQPNASNSGHSECKTLMAEGKAAMWYDATVFGRSLEDTRESKVAGKIGYAPAPVVKTKNSGWLWAWSLAIPITSKDPDAAWEFASWATSKEYVRLVGQELGWVRVPPGSRLSTYELPRYREATTAFAQATLDAIQTVNVAQPGVHPQPWVGVQYVGIPEFQGLGNRVSAEISSAIAGQQTVDEALAKAQLFAEDVVKGGGYRKNLSDGT
ncbi:MAG: sugar ABC transporter substrate-binding protein [Actinomycetota bacterium]|nr:sugar ABC transporter substrate-binding protein [Actinomycetota bacterium]